MTDTILPSLVFVVVAVATTAFASYLQARYRRWSIIKRLLGSEQEAKAFEQARLATAWQQVIASLGVLAMPKKDAEIVPIRQLLTYAGYRSPDAVRAYFGLKLSLGLAAGAFYLLLSWLAGGIEPHASILVFLPVALGYYLPGPLLHRQVRARKNRIFRELPDTLDLLLICLEAGLSFDLALYRVSKELAPVAPILSQEFRQYFLEIKTGLPRNQVLANLADRNGVDGLSSVVNVLTQSARIGTDVADALHVYSDALRQERRQIAEEKGAKIATKLTLPIVAFILPALLLIVLGPAIINFADRFQGL